ncbi:MAG: recombinase family protein [Candidatus Eisenbacteria bacterium]
MPPTTVLYARKSSESEDRQVLSIDSQISELKAVALRRGVPGVEVLTESKSAKAPGRPIFGQLMQRVRRGEVGTILCWKLDRLARNHLDHGRVLQALADRKLRIVTPERDYTEDGNDRFLGNFEFGMATKYIDDLRANVRRGNKARRERGWPNFRPPIGYLEDHAAKTVVKDPEKFPLVRRLWDYLLAGTHRPSQILKLANEEWGLRTRKIGRRGGVPMQIQHLYYVFANPFYMGVIRLRTGETHRGAFPAMVTPEQFEQAQAILGRPGRTRPSRHEFPYAGLLHCARCGDVLTPEEHIKRSGKRFVYYRCRARLGKAACAVPLLPEGLFERAAAENLARIAIPKDAVQWILENARGSYEADAERRRAARESLQGTLRDAAQEGEMLLTLRLRGQVDEESFEKRRVEIADRKVRLQLQLERPEARPDELLERVQRVLEFAANARAVFEISDAVRRKQIVQAVSSNWKVDGRKCLNVAKEPFSFIAEARNNHAGWACLEDVRTWVIDNWANFQLPELPKLHDRNTVPRSSG